MHKAVNLPILSFNSAAAWDAWLERNHAESHGIWLRFFKKNSGITTMTHAEALDEALCYGWIDGQLQKFDEKSWLQKFTPRRPKSIWSKKNIEHTIRLCKANRMKPAGSRQIEAAKTDGRWANAYDSPKAMQMPKDFLKELEKNKKAQAFFTTLNRTNTYAIAWRLATAKRPETREKRMRTILEMLAKHRKFHA